VLLKTDHVANQKNTMKPLYSATFASRATSQSSCLRWGCSLALNLSQLHI